jgi:hypothetical protein
MSCDECVGERITGVSSLPSNDRRRISPHDGRERRAGF